VNPVTANWSKKELDSAGKILVLGANRVDDLAVITAHQVLSTWRIAHENPLSGAMRVLRRYANQNGWNAIVSGRTKRFPSIIAKLVRYTTLKLSAMQDIGGCRIVLDDIDQAEFLASHVKHGLVKGFGSDRIGQPDDYIEKPKADGYRNSFGGLSTRASPENKIDPEHDVLSALVRWVEKGAAPEYVIASHLTDEHVDRTRPLCPYPKVARWNGSGSSDDAKNFTCAEANPSPKSLDEQ